MDDEPPPNPPLVDPKVPIDGGCPNPPPKGAAVEFVKPKEGAPGAGDTPKVALGFELPKPTAGVGPIADEPNGALPVAPDCAKEPNCPGAALPVDPDVAEPN